MTTETERVQPTGEEFAPPQEGTAPAETVEGLKAKLDEVRKELERERQRANSNEGSIRTRKQQDEAIRALERRLAGFGSKLDLALDAASPGHDPEELKSRRARLSQEELQAKQSEAIQTRSDRYIERINARMARLGIKTADDPRFTALADRWGQATALDDLDEAVADVNDLIDELAGKQKPSQEEIEKARNEAREQALRERNREDADLDAGRSAGGVTKKTIADLADSGPWSDADRKAAQEYARSLGI